MNDTLLELRGLAVDFATDDGTVHAVDGIDLALTLPQRIKDLLGRVI